MNSESLQPPGRIGALLGFAMLLLAGCATNSEVVDHAFSFDVRYDSQDAEVLDYRYGASQLPVRAPEYAVQGRQAFLSDQ